MEVVFGFYAPVLRPYTCFLNLSGSSARRDFSSRIRLWWVGSPTSTASSVLLTTQAPALQPRRKLHRACAGTQGNCRVVEAEDEVGKVTWEPCRKSSRMLHYYATLQGIPLEVGVSFERLALL